MRTVPVLDFHRRTDDGRVMRGSDGKPPVAAGPNRPVSEFVAARFPDGYRGYAMDVGASDGVSVSSTFYLEHEWKWHVVAVEANPDFKSALALTRAFVEMSAVSDHVGEETFHVNLHNLEAISSLRPTTRVDLLAKECGPESWDEIKVRVTTVDALMEKWQLPRLDALFIDTEGTELDVLKGCDLDRWRPRVIVTECWDATGPIDDYLGPRYRKEARMENNDLWVLR